MEGEVLYVATKQTGNVHGRNRLTKQQWAGKLRLPFIIIMFVNAIILSGIVVSICTMEDTAQIVFQLFGLR